MIVYKLLQELYNVVNPSINHPQNRHKWVVEIFPKWQVYCWASRITQELFQVAIPINELKHLIQSSELFVCFLLQLLSRP